MHFLPQSDTIWCWSPSKGMHTLPLNDMPLCDVDPFHIAYTVHLRTSRMREIFIVDPFVQFICPIHLQLDQNGEIDCINSLTQQEGHSSTNNEHHWATAKCDSNWWWRWWWAIGMVTVPMCPSTRTSAPSQSLRLLADIPTDVERSPRDCSVLFLHLYAKCWVRTCLMTTRVARSSSELTTYGA